MTSSTLLPFFTSLILTMLIIPGLRVVAIQIGLTDKPNIRKVHATPIPLVGGIAVFIAASLSFSLSMPFDPSILIYKNLFIALVILLTMGVIDDKFDLRASFKLIIQLLLAHYTFTMGIKIESLYGLFGMYDLPTWGQYTLTLVIITGVVNAFNLMDGIDGLAGGLGILGFTMLTIFALLNNHVQMAVLSLAFVGALIGFLKFNFSKSQKIFMGDAGSLMIGFVLVVASIHLLQLSATKSNSTFVLIGVISILLLPVIDAIRVFRGRLKKGKSPFHADRTHLHHLVLATGLKHRKSTISILVMVLVISIVGFFLHYYTNTNLAILGMIITLVLIISMLQFNTQIQTWKGKIKLMEANY
jgi:UDP-GlcNAc:undecaprenyl-phosphate/decaprenyl-phosphate GlcNAc-1-phosphate transferase